MNKKFFIFLISLFSFISIDNVKAEEYSYDISDDLIPVFENYTFNTWSTASESSNYNQFKTQIDNVLNKKTSIECVNEIVDNYSNYIFIYGNGNNRAIFWNGNDYEARFGGGYGSYWSMGKQVNGTKIGLYNSISTGNEKVIYLPADGEYTCSNSYYWTDKQATNTTPLLSYTSQGSNVPNDIITNYNDGYFPTVYTNKDIKVGNYSDGKTTADFGVSVSYAYDSFTLNGKTYNVDDVIIPRNDTVIPKITFSVSENKETINGEEIVTSKDLTVNFSIIDNENYRYLISFDRENWSSITIDEGNSMTFNIKENKTVYVQVLNASDYSMVTSATYTIDGIIDKPSIYYNIIDEEKVPKAEKVYVVSKTLRTTFDIIDNDKYVYAYSLDGENWKTIKLVNGINYFDLKFNQEETVRTRILDRNTGKLITSATFTVGGITGYESSDGVIYKNLLKIPISSLYENGVWKTYQFVFMSDTENTYNYDIRIELVPFSNINDNNPIPLQIYMGQEISDIKEYQEKIQNSPTSDPDGYGGGFTMNGGTFGGGGGGGRFDENDIYHSCSTLPISESSTFKSKLNYKVVTILTNSCSDISSLTPSDFTTEYIYIYYNARMYESVEDAIDDNLNIDIPDDNIFYDNIIKPIIELINKKMPIIAQLKNILDSFQYVEENDFPPQFNVDLTSIGIPYNGIVVDFSFYAQYRDIIFFWIKVIFSVKTLIKILNIVKNMFGGGF